MAAVNKAGHRMIAKVINTRTAWCEDRQMRTQASMLHVVARDLAMVLQQDNPLFDSERFLKACGAE